MNGESSSDNAPRWDPPGPGTWTLDASHSSPAPGPILRELYTESTAAGFGEGFEMVGAPLAGIETAWVNGKQYSRLVPLVGGSSSRAAPPPPVLKVITRLHPAFRRRERRAAASFAERFWLAELQRWRDEWRPQLTAVNEAHTAVEVARLDDGELATHIESVHEHLRSSLVLHFRLHVSDMGPLGDLMVHLEDWGLTRQDTFRALRAASPATREPARRLAELARALGEAGVDPEGVSSLGEIRAASEHAAALLDAYLGTYGWRLTSGYDLEDCCLIELPDTVVASLRAAAAAGSASDREESESRESEQGAAELAALREEIPDQDRGTFDELVAAARASYGIRDENGPITVQWPAGLLRRALLEAGRRLAAPESGRLEVPEQVFELTVAEITALLRGDGGPDSAEIARRAAERRRWAALNPPARLGPEEAPPPLEAMPPSLRRITRIVLAVTQTLEADASRGSDLTGMGVGNETYRGTARVVRDAVEALANLEPGDIVVAAYTAPTYNAVLSMAGAIVTEEGGLLCHAAVIARELGIPAVIGVADAMTLVPDGATVEVDPTLGQVRVLD